MTISCIQIFHYRLGKAGCHGWGAVMRLYDSEGFWTGCAELKAEGDNGIE